MDAFYFAFSDSIWLPLLEFLILIVFLRSVFCDISARRRPRRRKSGATAKVQRGERSWAIFLAFLSSSIILVGIIVSSELISNHKIIVSLFNVGMLVYLNLFSSYFQNKIIGWYSKLQQRWT